MLLVHTHVQTTHVHHSLRLYTMLYIIAPNFIFRGQLQRSSSGARGGVAGVMCFHPQLSSEHRAGIVPYVYIVPRTGRLTTRERTILENTTVRWPEQTRHLVYASTTAT